MANKKQYTIRHYHSSRIGGAESYHDYTGTLEYLENEVFGYTLDCGNSWNHKIPRFPKNGRSLEKALNDSAYECRRYNDSYELIA